MDDSLVHDVKVLYVEDDALARQTLSLMLGRCVRTLVQAENGERGLALFQEHDPDIVITDLNMPVMDGLTMARAIKELNSHTQIVVATAHDDAQFLMEAITIGVDRYVLKPIEMARLLEAVEHCTSIIMLERQVARHTEEREQMLEQLRQALAEVKTLRGLLPICANCKKIRDDQGYWNVIEDFVSSHSEAEFSHGICPECTELLYPQYAHRPPKQKPPA